MLRLMSLSSNRCAVSLA